MYSQGQDRYLADLDCVNIVKSIRELKTLTKIIFTQHQKQLLEFEHANILPTNMKAETKENQDLKNYVPFENSSKEVKHEYFSKVDKFIDNFANEEHTNIDLKIINELASEDDSVQPETTKLHQIHPKIIKVNTKKTKIIDYRR